MGRAVVPSSNESAAPESSGFAVTFVLGIAAGSERRARDVYDVDIGIATVES